MTGLNVELAKLPAVLEGVRFAILYGSAATGDMWAESDIDLAVMYASPLEPEDMLRLMRETSAIFHRSVDILDLNRAGPIVKMQVLRYGRPVVINDEAAFQRFAMYTPSEYFDLKIRRHPIEEAIMAAVLS